VHARKSKEVKVKKQSRLSAKADCLRLKEKAGDQVNTKLMVRVIGLPLCAAAAAWLIAPLAEYYRAELTLGAGGLVLFLMIYREWLRKK